MIPSQTIPYYSTIITHHTSHLTPQQHTSHLSITPHARAHLIAQQQPMPCLFSCSFPECLCLNAIVLILSFFRREVDDPAIDSSGWVSPSPAAASHRPCLPRCARIVFKDLVRFLENYFPQLRLFLPFLLIDLVLGGELHIARLQWVLVLGLADVSVCSPLDFQDSLMHFGLDRPMSV